MLKKITAIQNETNYDGTDLMFMGNEVDDLGSSQRPNHVKTQRTDPVNDFKGAGAYDGADIMCMTLIDV